MFHKGMKKIGGRKKGVPNKWNFPDIKEICRDKKYDPLIELIEDLPNLSTEMRARVHIAILPYTRPKPKIEVEIETSGGLLGHSNPLRNKSADELIELLPVTNAPGKSRP